MFSVEFWRLEVIGALIGRRGRGGRLIIIVNRSPSCAEPSPASQAWGSNGSTDNMDILPVLACTCLAFGLYLNTLPADFAYDDSRAILKNPDLLSETPLINVFYDDFWGTPLTHSGSHKSYRPLCVLTFRLNHALGELNPWGYHLTNVILHSLVTGVFTYTASRILVRRLPATTAGLLFASHPIHTEAVAGVVGRADILACLFFLLAFLCYRRYCKYRDKSWNAGRGGVKPHPTENYRTWRWAALLGVATCTAASMLCKEIGVTVLAVCATYDLFVQNNLKVTEVFKIFYQKRLRNVLEGVLALFTVGLTLVGFRIYFMGNKAPEFAPADNPASDSESPLTRTLTYFYLPFLNLWLLLYPNVLSFDWSMDAVPLIETYSDLRNLCTLTCYSLLGYVGYYIVTRLGVATTRYRNGHAVVSSGNGCTPHPNSSTPPLATKPPPGLRRRFARRGSSSSTNSDDEGTGTHGIKSSSRTLQVLIVALAFLIFPFIPATNLFFYVGFVIAERVLYIPSMGFCLLVAQGVQVMHAKYAAKDMWRRQVIILAVGVLATAYSLRTVVRNQDWLTEENLYRSGISVNPAKAYGNLGSILNTQGKVQEAEEAYRLALRQRGNMADVHYNLGILLQEQKRYSEAVESYQMAIKCRPRLTMAYLNLGIVYGLLGQKEDAEKMYKMCTEIDISGLKDPRLHENTKISSLYNLGRLYADMDRQQDAIDTYKEAIRRRPSHYQPQSLYNMLGEAYSKLDELGEAEHWYREALRAKPDHIPAHLTMAKLMHRRNNLAAAEEWFKKAIEVDHQKGSVYQHYGQFLGETGHHQEAAEYYVKAAEWAPDDFELIFNTANSLRQAGRNEEAEQHYKRAAHVRPEVATAHMNLGAMLHFNGKLEEAEQSYKMALKLKPDDTVTQNNLKKLRSLMSQKAGKGKR